QKYVRPFYQKKSVETQKAIHKLFAGTNYYVHKSEGSIFQWLLMPSLKITTMKFYSELKKRGVIVVPGEYFFFGAAPDKSLPPVEEHPHYSKCLRLNYAGDQKETEGGLKIIAELYKKYS
ncbi:MAG: valine--pyruvate transaminase, partial [Treponema sp.]|nr:valine--pyruvate transaminase [Treponema sp.]